MVHPRLAPLISQPLPEIDDDRQPSTTVPAVTAAVRGAEAVRTARQFRPTVRRAWPRRPSRPRRRSCGPAAPSDRQPPPAPRSKPAPGAERATCRILAPIATNSSFAARRRRRPGGYCRPAWRARRGLARTRRRELEADGIDVGVALIIDHDVIPRLGGDCGQVRMHDR